MQHYFSYDKKKVIQALRYHFIQRQEIRVLLILVNVFAILSAILFYTQKIRPEPFLLGSLLWMLLMASFWYILPNQVYRRSVTFRENFMMEFTDLVLHLENERGHLEWEWEKFSRFFESPHFFHLYFDSKSFFLIPKENMGDAFKDGLREILNRHVGKTGKR